MHYAGLQYLCSVHYILNRPALNTQTAWLSSKKLLTH